MTGYPDGLWGKHFWHQFGSTADDGSDPVGGLILGSDGDLYGTTTGGGSTGNGRIYKVNPKSHELTIVYSFPRITYNGPGVLPNAHLLQAKSDPQAKLGNFYGGTAEGFYGGAIFVMTPEGKVAPPFDEFCCDN